MIVVLDTNVIISALLSPQGAPAEIIRRWERDEFEVVTSPLLITELERVLTYDRVKKYLTLSQEETETLLQQFRTVTRVVEPQLTLEVVEADPDDNRVLECALAGGASYIVSGNNHLLDLKEYEQIMILIRSVFLPLLNTFESARQQNVWPGFGKSRPQTFHERVLKESKGFTFGR